MKAFFFILVIILIPFVSVLAEEAIFIHEDEIGDDYGPGNYVYPLHPHFHPHEGLFDLHKFRVRAGEEIYYFDFTFGKLTDPWESFFGFTHPLVHLYIDNSEGGSTEPVKPVLEVEMSPEFPWNRAIVFSGWWIQGLKEGEEWRSPEEDVSWESPRPTSLEGSDLSVEGDTITLEVPAEWIGPLEDARYYVLVGAYDPLDPYYFREISEQASLWSFGGGEGENGNHPIIDILVPENLVQEELLAYKNPVLQPIGPIPPEEINYHALILITLFFLILIGGGFFLVWKKKAS